MTASPAESALVERLRQLDERLRTRLEIWDPLWEERAGDAAVEANVRRRHLGQAFTDAETFEAVVRAALSGNTTATTVQRIAPELTEPFQGFDLAAFAERLPAKLEADIMPWFLARKAGSTGLRRTLRGLHGTALRLVAYARDHGAAERFFADCLTDSGTIEDAAVAIGSSGQWKLPGFGVALAAEALKFLGYDVCKPDRHVMRCVGAWSLVTFRKWPIRGEFTPPMASIAELRETMLAVRALAGAAGLTINQENSAIWIAGALSGARLTTEDFEILGSGLPKR